MSSPCLSPPSEGEIVESDSEKATTATISKRGNSVDHSFRRCVSVSRSPTPVRSPRRHKSRIDSRSPYREAWGLKRLVDDDHYDRSRSDPRRFKIRYEDHPQGSRSQVHRSYHDVHRSDVPDRSIGHETKETDGWIPGKRPIVRSRSPLRGRSRREGARERHAGAKRDRHQREQGDRGYKGSCCRLSREQSVSDRGHSPVATAQLKREAETRSNQIQRIETHSGRRSDSSPEYVPSSLGLQAADSKNDSTTEKDGTDVDRVTQPTNTLLADEATLIEERRKRREAIKARYRGQATPLPVQALVVDNNSAPSTPKSTVIPEDDPAQGKPRFTGWLRSLIRNDKRRPHEVLISPPKSYRDKDHLPTWSSLMMPTSLIVVPQRVGPEQKMGLLQLIMIPLSICKKIRCGMMSTIAEMRCPLVLTLRRR